MSAFSLGSGLALILRAFARSPERGLRCSTMRMPHLGGRRSQRNREDLMTRRTFVQLAALLATGTARVAAGPKRRTRIEIVGQKFRINGKPTYVRRSWRGRPIEGLLFNARMVNGIFDDLNPETRARW